MNQQPDLVTGNALLGISHDHVAEDPSSLTFDELRELPHRFALGFDVDAGDVAGRSAQL